VRSWVRRLALLFVGLAAMNLLPVAAVLLAIVFVIRSKRGLLKFMWLPGGTGFL